LTENQVIIYFESPNGQAGFSYARTRAKLTGLRLKDGHHRGIFYYPFNGTEESFLIKLKEGAGISIVPAFKDDLAIIIR
jgi:hypothetical protein